MQRQQLCFTTNNAHTHTTVLRRFFQDYPGEPVPEENLLLDFYGAREDNRGTHTDHLAGRHSIWTNQRPYYRQQWQTIKLYLNSP